MLIESRTFTMGSPPTELQRGDDETIREIRIDRPFYMAAHQVTQEQYAAVVGDNPSTFKGDKRPVENVTWEDAANFCQLLSERTGRTVRLPTEAEWEYACRAGMTAPFSTGATITAEQANFNASLPYGDGPVGENRARTTDVGTFPPNPWGLYDMHGNVQEWCQDWYGPYDAASTLDPSGPAGGEQRVLRGGSWRSPPDRVRSASRDASPPDGKGRQIGFRFVVEP